MEDLIKQLNNLPKAKLSKKKDFKLRLSLYNLTWQCRKDSMIAFWNLKCLRPVMAAMVVLLITAVSVPAYAYSSSQVTRGHVLYPVKKVIEAAEISLAQSEEAKIEKDIKMTERRLGEAEVLSSRPDSQKELVRTINEARQYSNEAKLKEKEIDDQKESPEINSIIAENKSQQVSSLAVIAQNVGVRTSEIVLDSVALAIEEAKSDKFQAKENIKDNKKDIIASSSRSWAATTKEKQATEKAASSSFPEEESAYKNAGENGEKEKKIDYAKFTFKELVEKINGLKQEIKTEEYEKDDVNTLFKHFNKRIEKAEELIENEQTSELKDILESTEALTNNAKSFIKPKKEKGNNKNKRYNTEEDEGQHEEVENEENSRGNNNKLNKNRNK